MSPPKINKFHKKSKNRANKIHLVFDEEKRREFLTGFHKRKLQRKKHAQETLEIELKEERKRLKAEAKESYKKLVVSRRPIPELEELLAEEYEDDDVNVRVVELSTDKIAKESNWIGANQPAYESEGEEQSSGAEEDGDKEEVPGMELKRKPTVNQKVEKTKFSTEREVKKALKKQATKNVQKSKVFQMKNKIERQKQKKKSMQQKKERIKIRSKQGKRKGGGKTQ